MNDVVSELERRRHIEQEGVGNTPIHGAVRLPWAPNNPTDPVRAYCLRPGAPYTPSFRVRQQRHLSSGYVHEAPFPGGWGWWVVAPGPKHAQANSVSGAATGSLSHQPTMPILNNQPANTKRPMTQHSVAQPSGARRLPPPQGWSIIMATQRPCRMPSPGGLSSFGREYNVWHCQRRPSFPVVTS